MLRRRWPVIALVLWSGFVWGTRIKNTVEDAEATTSTRIGAITLSGVILGLAIASAAALWTSRTRSASGRELRVWQLLAGVTAVVWVVRGMGIATADYSNDPAIGNPTAFKIVHLVLGAISLVLAGLTARMTLRESSLPAPGERPLIEA